MRITRRQVLAATALTAASTAGGVAAVGYAWWDQAPAPGLRALAPSEHAFAQALAEAWMPPGGDPPLSGADARLGDWLDGLLDGQPATPRTQLKLLLHALDHLTLPTHGAPYTTLPLDTRTTVLRGWLQSDQYLLRNGVQAVVVLLSLGWTLHPDVVGLVRPWFGCAVGR